MSQAFCVDLLEESPAGKRCVETVEPDRIQAMRVFKRPLKNPELSYLYMMSALLWPSPYPTRTPALSLYCCPQRPAPPTCDTVTLRQREHRLGQVCESLKLGKAEARVRSCS